MLKFSKVGTHTLVNFRLTWCRVRTPTPKPLGEPRWERSYKNLIETALAWSKFMSASVLAISFESSHLHLQLGRCVVKVVRTSQGSFPSHSSAFRTFSEPEKDLAENPLTPLAVRKIQDRVRKRGKNSPSSRILPCPFKCWVHAMCRPKAELNWLSGTKICGI